MPCPRLGTPCVGPTPCAAATACRSRCLRRARALRRRCTRPAVIQDTAELLERRRQIADYLRERGCKVEKPDVPDQARDVLRRLALSPGAPPELTAMVVQRLNVPVDMRCVPWLRARPTHVHALRGASRYEDTDYMTLFMMAAYTGNLPLMRWLHSNGANVHATEFDGLTAWDLAAQRVSGGRPERPMLFSACLACVEWMLCGIWRVSLFLTAMPRCRVTWR